MELMDLVAKARSGDKDAATQLLEAVLPRVRLVILGYSRDMRQDDIDDLQQRVILRIYSNLIKYNLPEDRFLSWCAIIARNMVKDYSRRKHFESASSRDSSCADDDIGSKGTIDFYRVVEEAADLLPKDQRRLVRARMEGKEYDEIARNFGLSETLARKKHEKAFEMLTSIVLTGT